MKYLLIVLLKPKFSVNVMFSLSSSMFLSNVPFGYVSVFTIKLGLKSSIVALNGIVQLVVEFENFKYHKEPLFGKSGNM